MSEQENKIPTAVEIEQALRERHQKEIEQNDKRIREMKMTVNQ
ncbi:hypothetical protein [Escherichia coli]|nr:hypothetical protein [Escherichia coli]